VLQRNVRQTLGTPLPTSPIRPGGRHCAGQPNRHVPTHCSATRSPGCLSRIRAIVARVPRTTRNGWWLVARTKIIDDATAEAIADGCDRVLNLAAGLDTRPYRLDLPPDLTWVEADLPVLVAITRRTFYADV
jgi:Leucine carboxyl methyltransferase